MRFVLCKSGKYFLIGHLKCQNLNKSFFNWFKVVKGFKIIPL